MICVVDPKLFFLDPDPTLNTNTNPGPDVYEKYIWNADHLIIAKKQIKKICTFLDPDCLENFIFNCRSSKHYKKAHFYI
jgi:hypothetical protein